jgi:phosphoribosylanthranilate isomerase
MSAVPISNTNPDFETRIIKVCGITTVEDGVAAVEAGATAIGLNFYSRSPRWIDSERARHICAMLPKGVLRVGIFVNPTLDELLRYANDVPLDVVQIHGAYPKADTRMRVWRALAVDRGFCEDALAEEAEAFLLDAPTTDFGGSGRTFEWSQAARVARRFIVAGGLSEVNVAAAIAATKPWGVDACSGLEWAPGKKDTAKMRAFVAAALGAFEMLSEENRKYPALPFQEK